MAAVTQKHLFDADYKRASCQCTCLARSIFPTCLHFSGVATEWPEEAERVGVDLVVHSHSSSLGTWL